MVSQEQIFRYSHLGRGDFSDGHLFAVITAGGSILTLAVSQ